MRTSVAQYLRDNKKVYRLGLIGLSGAGKSCILAALRMPRIPNPKRYTATKVPRLPGIEPTRNGDPRGWPDLDSNPISAFYAGAAWLDQVEAALREGRPVPPNPPGARLITLYDFTFPSRGSVRVELIDYSGELLQQTNEALMVNLRRHLERLDGLLILAEAPAPGKEKDRLPDELLRLQEALKTLSGQLKNGAKWDVPVALLFNKWDRRGIPQDDKERQSAIDQLLRDSPAHQSVRNDLANTVAGDMQPFAVSALGPVERHELNGHPHERPENCTPLHSYGLEDPFEWVIRERDRIDWRRFGAAGAKGRWYAFWNVRATLRALKQGKDLMRRYSSEQREHQGAAAAMQEVSKRARRQGALCALLMLFSFFVAWQVWETYLDDANYSRVKTALAAEIPSSERLGESSGWLDEYANSGWHRHLTYSVFVLSREKVREELSRCQERQLDWEGRVRSNHGEVVQLEGDVEAMLASGSRDLARLKPLADRLKAMPSFPEADDEALRSRREGVRRQLLERRKEIERLLVSREGQRRLQEFDGLMKADKVTEAARLIEEAPPEERESLRPEFRRACLPKLREIYRRMRNAGENASLLKRLTDAYDDRHVTQILSRDDRQTLGDLVQKANREWDRDLYATFKKDRREEDGKRYLKEAPVRRMEKPVQAYVKYLADLREPQKFTLSVSEVAWSEWWTSTENEISLKVTNGEATTTETATVKRDGSEKRSSDAVSLTFNARPGDEVVVEVVLSNTKGWSVLERKRPGGTGKFRGPVTDLREKDLTLNDSPRAKGASVTLSLRGSLSEPSLPDWSD